MFYSRNDKILDLCYLTETSTNFHKFLKIMIPTLYKNGELSWNPTVNKMTALALQKLQSKNEILFNDSVDEYLLLNQKQFTNKSSMMPPKPVSKATSQQLQEMKSYVLPPMPTNFQSTSNDPTMRPLRSIQSLGGWKNTNGTEPPLTITGIAPWAVKNNNNNDTSNNSSFPPKIHPKFNDEIIDKQITNRELLLNYIVKCLPKDDRLSTDNVNDWRLEQAAIVPKLLPNLKFHDLVFGKELGKGAFSIVKYARLINKDKNQSLWSEYAVKIITESSLNEFNYHKSVIREISILQLFHHPGITRLISSFYYNKSSYMIIEYASDGDLHSYIINNGSLAHKYIKFIIGEVTYALLSIHEAGFSFNDLKPENILITEIGHIKLTDFGATRPITKEAEINLIDSRKLLGNLRNGDWRTNNNKSNGANKVSSETLNAIDTSKAPEITEEVIMTETTNGTNNNENNETDETNDWLDIRLEGTPGYLPMEVLENNITPNITSDIWSLGCVLVFCYLGRPKYYGDKNEVLLQLKNDFEYNISQNEDHIHYISRDNFWNSIVPTSDIDSLNFKELLQNLWKINPNERILLNNVINSNYLTINSDGTPIQMNSLQLHFNEPLILPKANNSHMKVHNSEDELWARRQFSTLWAPMPSDSKQTDMSMTLVSIYMNFY